MKLIGTAVFILVGLAIAGFAANVAINGAEPRIPSPSECIEGELAEGPTTASPVGEPFLYAEVRIQDADNTQANVGTIHWRGAYGNPDVVVRTASGDRRVHLPAPGRWRVLDGMEESIQVHGLEQLPIVRDIEPGERLSPPFRVSVRALRPGMHIIVARDGSARIPVYVGDRAALERMRAEHESARWPIVILLSIMAGVSFFVAHRVRQGSMFGPSEPRSE